MNFLLLQNGKFKLRPFSLSLIVFLLLFLKSFNPLFYIRFCEIRAKWCVVMIEKKKLNISRIVFCRVIMYFYKTFVYHFAYLLDGFVLVQLRFAFPNQNKFIASGISLTDPNF